MSKEKNKNKNTIPKKEVEVKEVKKEHCQKHNNLFKIAIAALVISLTALVWNCWQEVRTNTVYHASKKQIEFYTEQKKYREFAKKLDNIDAKGIEKLINDKKKDTEYVLFAYEECPYCVKYSKTLSKLIKNHPELKLHYYDVSKLNEEEYVKLVDLGFGEDKVGQTPSIYVIKEGKIKDSIIGLYEYDYLENYLKKNK